MKDNSAELAFPYSTIDGYSQDGMTLRDYFASKAMQGLLSATTVTRITLISKLLILLGSDKWKAKYDFNGDIMSVKAYEIADSMLKQRLK